MQLASTTASASCSMQELDDDFTGLGSGGYMTVAGFGSLLSGEHSSRNARPCREIEP
jgi:hypothetical protein